jgi:hypothetical protein
LADLLNHSGLTSVGEEILNGHYVNQERPPDSVLREFLTQLAIPDALREVPPISIDISVDEYSKAIKRWKESTATSPSGRHLGFYKVTLGLGQITQDMCEMLNIVIRVGIVPARWCKAISVLLEKDPGQPNINRLRVIHLFEADYNLFLKVLWAQRLVKQGEENAQFGEAQQGSRAGRTANDAVLLKRLSYDLSRITKTNLATFDNDAKSCYDRVVNSVAMLASKRMGMPDSAITTHAGVLREMKYVVKTAFGISNLHIKSSPTSTLFGTGQGSGASPAVWL